METSMYIASEETPDGVLIQQASEGNEEAFEILVRRYRAVLFRLIYNNLGNYHTSYDVLQHVFIQLYVSLKKIQVDTSFESLYQTRQSFSQIGRQLRVSEATVKTHFLRAKPLLRKALREAK